MPETRDFPTAVIASLSTGVLLCKFGEMHEAAEYLLGHPVWTHHFGSKELWHKMQCAVIGQCPGMPVALPDANADNYLAKLADIEAEIGKVVKIRKGRRRDGDASDGRNPRRHRGHRRSNRRTQGVVELIHAARLGETGAEKRNANHRSN